MELCLAGLFFLVFDTDDRGTCTAKAIIYEAALHSIGKRKAMHTSNGIQIDNDENTNWKIILKGVKILDPATLPKGGHKGPLEDISAAEKVATYNFMQRAGFGTSLENQQHCRGL